MTESKKWSTNYDDNVEKLNKSLSTINKDYGFLYFQPSASSINTSNLDLCYVGTDSNSSNPVPSVTMYNINNLIVGTSSNPYHTNDSCKLNAAILESQYVMSDEQKFKNKTKNPGLNFNVINQYYNKDVKMFLKFSNNPSSSSSLNSYIYSGLATRFDNINNATNKLIIGKEKYSVEWYGFFCPSSTGNWTFTINSTNPAYIWIGDIAINDYQSNNSLINTINSQSVSGTANFLMNRYYPIRIQYGNRLNTDTFSLTITGPDSHTNGIPLLYTFYNSDGSLFEKSIVYYSLVDSGYANKGLYSCYVTNPDKETYMQLKNYNSSFNTETVWSLFNEDTDDNLLDPNNYLSIDSKTNYISIYNSGNVLKTLSDSNGNPVSSTGNIKLGEDGTLQVEQLSSPGTFVTVSKNKTGLNTPDSNSSWSSKKVPNNIKITPSNNLTNKNNDYVLISSNLFYALTLNYKGNLNIVQNIKACTTKDSNGIHYTSSTSNTDINSRYLYRINGDEKINNLYMVNKNSQTLLPVDKNIKNINLLKGIYTKYPEYYPSNSSNSIADPNSNCQSWCDKDSTCSYYYSYTENGKPYCQTNSAPTFGSDLTPKLYVPKQPTNRDSDNSTLHLRNIGMNSLPNDARSQIGRTDTSDYTSYQNYELLGSQSFILDDSKKIGFNGLDTPLKKELISNWNYINGSGQPIKSPEVETFDNQGYKTSSVVRNIGGNPGNNKSLPNQILNDQVYPMIAISKDYANLQNQINNKYNNIDSNINKITNDNQSGARDLLKTNDIYDYNANTLIYSTKKKHKEDAIKDDVNIMLMQTNDLFILGSLGVATLLIAAIYFGKE
jgi:hypothetical protein